MTSTTDPESAGALQAAFAFDDDDGFEAIYTRLEGVTKRLEEGGLTLDQTLALYEQGIALSRRAQALLDAAEQRIEVLRQGGD